MSAFTESVYRVKRLFATMTETLDAHPERGEERIVMLFTIPREGRGPITGMLSHGYGDEGTVESVQSAQLADLMFHLTTMFRREGVALMLFPIRHD